MLNRGLYFSLMRRNLVKLVFIRVERTSRTTTNKERNTNKTKRQSIKIIVRWLVIFFIFFCFTRPRWKWPAVWV